MFLFEQQVFLFVWTAISSNVPAINKKISFNCCPIADNCCSQKNISCCSQKNKLFSVVNVVVSKSKTSCHQVVVSFWRCKVTTFGKGIVRFGPFTSIKCVIWPNKSVSVPLQLQVDAILLGNIPHRHWWQQLVAGSYAEYGEFFTMARKPSL